MGAKIIDASIHFICSSIDERAYGLYRNFDYCYHYSRKGPSENIISLHRSTHHKNDAGCHDGEYDDS